MESQVTKPIEDQLSGISGIKNINSVTRKGRSMITVEFKLGWNMVEGVSDVRDALTRAKSGCRRMPIDPLTPRIAAAAMWRSGSTSAAARWIAPP